MQTFSGTPLRTKFLTADLLRSWKSKPETPALVHPEAHAFRNDSSLTALPPFSNLKHTNGQSSCRRCRCARSSVRSAAATGTVRPSQVFLSSAFKVVVFDKKSTWSHRSPLISESLIAVKKPRASGACRHAGNVPARVSYCAYSTKLVRQSLWKGRPVAQLALFLGDPKHAPQCGERTVDTAVRQFQILLVQHKLLEQIRVNFGRGSR